MTDLFLNATALSRLSCRRRYQVQCLWGYDVPASQSAGFGSAFHSFAERLESPNSEVDFINYFTAISPSQDKALLKLCHYYSQVNPFKGTPPLINSKGEPALEYKFSFPYLTIGEYRIILCGTIDRIDWNEDSIRIIDRKTSRNTKIKDVLEEYEMHIQIPFYQWIFKNFLATEFDEQTRAAAEARHITGYYHGIFLSFEPVKFELGKVIQLTLDMERDIGELIRTAAYEMVAIASEYDQKLAPPTGMSAQVCKYCMLNNLCRTRNNLNVYKFLEGLTPKPYDPRTWR